MKEKYDTLYEDQLLFLSVFNVERCETLLFRHVLRATCDLIANISLSWFVLL